MPEWCGQRKAIRLYTAKAEDVVSVCGSGDRWNQSGEDIVSAKISAGTRKHLLNSVADLSVFLAVQPQESHRLNNYMCHML